MYCKGRTKQSIVTCDSTENAHDPDPDPDPDPEPPAAPPIIILSERGNASAAPHSQPHPTWLPTSSQDFKSTASRYKLRTRKQSHSTTRGGTPEPPDPHPAAPPVIILSNKRPASASPPHSPTSIQTTTSIPPSIPSTAPSTSAPPAVGSVQLLHPVFIKATAKDHKHSMGSKGSKLAPAHGKLQPSQDKQDKAEMKEPSNYYTHRSKSMRRKAGKTGATSGTGGSGGGAGGGVGGAV